MPSPSIHLSQDNLFFPLPITTPIENILQITNKESTKIAYKIRSTIRNRYCVKPSVGYLHPREETVAKFLIDPSTMMVDGKEPSEMTLDFFFIDFAFVSKEEETVAAAVFWKQDPPGAARDITRRKLQCVFPSKKAGVPDSLVMRIETPKLQCVPSKILGQGDLRGSASSATAAATAAVASAGAAGMDTENSQSTSSTGPLFTPSFRGTSPSVASPPVATPGQLPVAQHAAVPLPVPVPDRASGSSPAVASSTATDATASENTPSTVAAAAPPPKEPPFLTKFIFFTIPLPAVVMLVLASGLAALVEDNTWLTQLLRSVRGD